MESEVLRSPFAVVMDKYYRYKKRGFHGNDYGTDAHSSECAECGLFTDIKIIFCDTSGRIPAGTDHCVRIHVKV